jgi:hypothetical protein
VLPEERSREVRGRDRTAIVPYATLVRQFHAAPPGKLYLLHGGERVFRFSLAAAAQALVAGVPMTVVDGANRFDAYFIAEFARRFTAAGTGRRITPEELLERIYVSRAFTCYQMEALITDRLPAFLALSRSPVAIIFGLLDTFYDDQAPLFEVRNGLRRIVGVLQRLKRGGTSILLASANGRPVPPERRGLQGTLHASMDRVYMLEEERREPRRERHGAHGTDIHDGHPAGAGQLGEVPAGAAPRGPGGAGRPLPGGAAAAGGERLRRAPDPIRKHRDVHAARAAPDDPAA